MKMQTDFETLKITFLNLPANMKKLSCRVTEIRGYEKQKRPVLTIISYVEEEDKCVY